MLLWLYVLVWRIHSMKVSFENSVKKKVLDRITRLRNEVILRRDLEGTGEYRQVSRALNKLIAQKKLVKIGSWIYAKAYLSKYSDFPLIRCGTHIALRKALDRINVRYEPGSAEQAYNNAGKSTQIPAKNMVKLKSRCRRKLYYGNSQLFYENNINAK